MSFNVNNTKKTLDETPCQSYAVDQIIREIDYYGPMSNSEIGEAYDFYMEECSEGGAVDAIFI